MQKAFPFMPALKYDYPKVMKHFFSPEDNWDNVFPTLFPQWDRTPRAGKHEGIYVNATPENFEQMASSRSFGDLLGYIAKRSSLCTKVIFSGKNGFMQG